jgi:hypothetical protein
VQLRALVEAVDLELQPVEAEVADQVALERASGDVRDPVSTEVGVDGEPAEVGDPAADVGALEAHRPGALAVDLDDEDAERLRLSLRALDLRADLVVVGDRINVAAARVPRGKLRAGRSEPPVKLDA